MGIQTRRHSRELIMNKFEFTDEELKIIQWALYHWIECGWVEHDDEDDSESKAAYSAKDKLTAEKDFMYGDENE